MNEEFLTSKDMNPKPKVTVFMTVYNGEKFLDECIKSILNQTLQDFEFIIVNDGSTDGSQGILNKYAGKDSRIKIIQNRQNFGVPKSLNKAIRAAKGEYLARMDADDIALPQRLEKQVDFLEKHREFFLIGCGAVYLDEKGFETKVEIPICNENKLIKNIAVRNQVPGSTVVFRNEGSNFYREKFYVV